MTILFLYGTLKQGQRNHFRMAGQHYVGPARTLPCYRLYDCGPYPGLVEDRAHGLAIAGELWQVDDAALHRLDEFEGAPLPDRALTDPEFRRDRIEVENQTEPVFGYFYCRDVSGMRDCGCQWPTT
jgi:gamma-glutamylcyclotransferase (GGCT)/AIG2-like uncharacterized protein YtfP